MKLGESIKQFEIVFTYYWRVLGTSIEIAETVLNCKRIFNFNKIEISKNRRQRILKLQIQFGIIVILFHRCMLTRDTVDDIPAAGSHSAKRGTIEGSTLAGSRYFVCEYAGGIPVLCLWVRWWDPGTLSVSTLAPGGIPVLCLWVHRRDPAFFVTVNFKKLKYIIFYSE